MHYAKCRKGEHMFTGSILLAQRNTPKGRLIEITAVGHNSAMIGDLNVLALPPGLLKRLHGGWLRLFVDADGKPTRAYVDGRKIFPRHRGLRRLNAFVKVKRWYIEYQNQPPLPGFVPPWK